MTTIFFPDVSEYDKVDIQPGTVVVVARATLSASVVDPRYTLFKAEAANQGSFFVAYHWLNHSNIQAQAQWCYQHVGKTPVMIDAEDVSGNTGYSGPLTVQDLLDFTAAYRALGGIVHLVYLPKWYWSDHMGSPDLTPLVAAGLHLVASNYTTYSDTGPGWGTYGHMSPDEWQYTDAMPYGGGSVDFNAYRGTVADFIALATGVRAVQAPTIKEVTTMLLRFPDTGLCVVTDGLGNWKGIPDTDALGVLIKATGLPVVDVTDDEALKLGIDRAHPPVPPAPVTAVSVTQDELNAAVASALTVDELTAALAHLSVKITLG